MEPVFDRLGMVLVSANRAQGGMGTIQAALAGVGVYGNADFVLWDSSMTEKDGRAQDLFFRQALLAGRRVPVLFDLGNGAGTLKSLRAEVGAHVGGVNTGITLLPKFRNTEMNFDEKKYNAKCWTARADVTPDVEQNQGYGGQASWHPGNWVHQSTARKISLVFLHALEEAFAVWEAAASAGGNPLDGKHWHLRDEEGAIRAAVRGADAAATGCGQLFSIAARLCATPMRGAAEWTPRNDPDRSSIRSLVMPSPRVGSRGGRSTLWSSTRRPQRHRRTGGDRDGNATLSRRRRRADYRFLDSSIPPPGKIVPGEGWSVQGHPSGFCDGTSNSVCDRSKSSNCLMSGHNDGRGHMEVDALSGWLVLRLTDVTEGLFMARVVSASIAIRNAAGLCPAKDMMRYTFHLVKLTTRS